MGFELKSKDVFNIDDAGSTRFGGDQAWFTQKWHRNAGCGPTAAANLIWYLSHTRPDIAGLCPSHGQTREDFAALMHMIWGYVTPGNMGVNKTSILSEGVTRYALEKGITLSAETIEIARNKRLRPAWDEVSGFVEKAIVRDVPVAFLNLSNGDLTNLDSWHWVTIVAYDTETLLAEISDEGTSKIIDLCLWYNTTSIGGGFVAIEKA